MSATILFRIGWMCRYRGLTASDRIVHGGRYIEEDETGGEIENFLPRNGRYRGYVRLPGDSLNMQRLGTARQAEWQDEVTVVFVATRPEGGMVVVGWYRNARVWREPQPQEPFGFVAEALVEESTLLDEDEREFAVPAAQQGAKAKFGMGNANVRYLDEPIAIPFVREITLYIEQHERARRRKRHPPRVDVTLRTQVEAAAVDCVLKHYERRGYVCKSVERDNVGWDLECERNGHTLRVEVKGCSGTDAVVELTPNEYEKMLQHRRRYRLAIVAKALSNPDLRTLKYHASDETWRDQNGRQATFHERVSARVHL